MELKIRSNNLFIVANNQNVNVDEEFSSKHVPHKRKNKLWRHFYCFDLISRCFHDCLLCFPIFVSELKANLANKKMATVANDLYRLLYSRKKWNGHEVMHSNCVFRSKNEQDRILFEILFYPKIVTFYCWKL